jgi:hypothetical protein
MHMQPLTMSPDDMLRAYGSNTAASTPRSPATLFRPPGAICSLPLHPVSFPFIWASLAPFTSNYPSLCSMSPIPFHVTLRTWTIINMYEYPYSR